MHRVYMQTKKWKKFEAVSLQLACFTYNFVTAHLLEIEIFMKPAITNIYWIL